MGSAQRKRGIDQVVDLTGPDDIETTRPDAAKQPRTIPSQLQRFGEETDFVPLSQTPLSQGGDDDDAQAEDLIQGSSQGIDIDDSSYATYVLYGELGTKIVGIRYYGGQATVGEHVVLRRQPGNPYDGNAITVSNVMGDQIGHIPRTMAAKLAKYMDSRAMIVEGNLTGVKGFYDCPVMLRLFGPSDPVRRAELKAEMEADRLPLGEFKRREREEQRRQKALEKQLAKEKKEAEKRARTLALKGAAAAAANMGYSKLSEGIPGEESLEDLIGQSSTFNPRDIGQVAEDFGIKEADMANMPMADTPEALSTGLLPFQRQGLAWMISKENPSLPAAGSEDVVQLWKRDGNKYLNIATNFSTSIAPPLASGGILADDMGLGKTIQVISLILANSQPKTATSSTTSLIVAPVGVMSNWKNQAEEHTHEDKRPRVLIYHGAGKKEARNLDQYDVVVTSYGALASEFNPNAKQAPAKGLFSLYWRRVVLDEGHTIRSPRSKGALAACSLRADSRWTLTGTPIINSLKDLYSQVRFLRLTGGLEDMAVFNSVLIRPLTSDDPNARLLLQALMTTICLRRRKDMEFINLRLPPLTSRVLRVKFHDHEKEKYEMFQSEAQGVLEAFKSNDKTNASYSSLLEVILRLRQVCNHWALCKNRIDNLTALLDKHKVVPLTPENIKALQDMLQIRIESQESCPICLDNLETPVITACGHSFCRGCIEEVIERQHKCPMCRADIADNTTLVSPAIEMGESADDIDAAIAADPSHPSSKISALIKVLTAQGQKEGTKTVVFSQWTSFLNLIEPHLTAHGLSYARIDGKMSSLARDKATHRFSHDPNCTVLLASLSVCSVGLNLVAANQAILTDSWWAPAIEDQAVDRVYRLGQTRETTIWRLVIEDSIEDRVLEVQDTKRKLMAEAFREKDARKKEDRATRVADIERLLT